MYIIKNALKSITRNKLRNILIGVIVLVIAVSACVALSIRQAAETTKQDTLNSMSVTAQISFDRTAAMQKMASSAQSDGTQNSADIKMDRGKFDFNAFSSSLTLDDYKTYTTALNDGDSYYYTGSISLNATGELLPYGTQESTDSSSDSTDAAVQPPV